jgi:hypothetical protein
VLGDTWVSLCKQPARSEADSAGSALVTTRTAAKANVGGQQCDRHITAHGDLLLGLRTMLSR